MKNLIEALQIFLKYADDTYPTHCEHDILYVVGVSKEAVSAEDVAKLTKLGFFWSDGDSSWISFHYGSA